MNPPHRPGKKRRPHRTRCSVCRGRFRPVRNDALTCSPACRQKGYRKRLSVTESVTDNIHFSSRTDLWATPQALFDALDAEFHFTLDVCAVPENAKCSAFHSPAEDGLRQVWQGVCWMNPPYGRAIGLWVAKAHAAAREGATVVALLPARTDTAWWHQYVAKAADIRYLRGRLRFGTAKNGAPFPSAVVVFKVC
jgi:phage N-6-adenine-methyltransferase